MREIHSVPFDNSLLRLNRKLIHRLDNALFNHKGSNGSAYEPTHYLLMLPFWYGVAAAIYCVYCSLTGPRNAELMAQRNVVIGIAWVVGANLLFMAKRIICMPTWPKRIFYPVFVVVVTALYAFVFLYISGIALTLIIIWFFLMVFLGSGGSRSSGGLFSSSDSNDYSEEVLVDDGTLWGKTLHRDNGCGLWSDRSGNQYEETCNGFEKKY